MKYRVHPQVVLEVVTDRYLLIAYGEAKDELPYIRELNETGAFYWNMVSLGYNTEIMLAEAARIYDVPLEILQKDLTDFVQNLEKNGYIFEESD